MSAPARHTFMERLARESVDLLVPASLATTITASMKGRQKEEGLTADRHASTTPRKGQAAEATPPRLQLPRRSAAGSSRIDPDNTNKLQVEGMEEEARVRWLFLLATFAFLASFQLSCLTSLSPAATPATTPAFPSSTVSSLLPTTLASTLLLVSSWTGRVCLASLGIEVAAMVLLYVTRRLPLAAVCLAGAGNVFVSGLLVLCGIQSEALVWFSHGPLVLFIVFGRRPGVYATLAVGAESLLLHFYLGFLAGSSPSAALTMGPLAKVIANLTVLASIGGMACASDHLRRLAFGQLSSALAQCGEAKRNLRLANETKQKFLANMSHELRTPLHGITSTAIELLETLPSTEKPKRECCQLIVDCGRMMRSLIEDLLDFEQLESNRLTLDKIPFNVITEVERSLCIAGPTVKKKKLDVDSSGMSVAFPMHLGDPLRFRQILFNLISNAVKFTPEGGKIHVSATNTEDNPEEIEVVISDTGIGISPQHLPHLFTGFYQEDNSTRRCNGGTGLGLAISKSLCEAMGGMINCQSTPGHGATFTFTVLLPVASTDSSSHIESPSAPVPPSSLADSERRPCSGHCAPPASSTFIPSPLTTITPATSPVMLSSLEGARVLLVEDNIVNQKVGVRMLKSFGCSVHVAKNGKECLETLELADSSSFGVVLMDCQMPVMDGFQATIKIREEELYRGSGKRLPVIALTASATKEYREQCFVSGMDDWLAKPFTKTNLARMILKWIRQREDRITTRPPWPLTRVSS